MIVCFTTIRPLFPPSHRIQILARVQRERRVVVGWVVVAATAGVLVRRGLALDEPPDVEEVVDGAREAERAGGRVAVDLPRRVEKGLEEGVVEVGDGDHKPLLLSSLEADVDGEHPLLHLTSLLTSHGDL